MRIYIYPDIPVARAATPRHEYIYIDRPSRHFSFGSSLRRPGPKCVSIPSILYLYRRDVAVFFFFSHLFSLRTQRARARSSFSMQFSSGTERVSDESSPTLMILSRPCPEIPGVQAERLTGPRASGIESRRAFEET